MISITPQDLQDTSFAPSMPDMRNSIEKAYMSFDKAYSDGYSEWIVMFSGGKDSTAVAALLCEWIKENPQKHIKPVFIYSNTGVEIPTLESQSLTFLHHLKNFGEIEIVQPNPDRSFWYLIAGKGYPAPHQKFRWCTDKLKIQPTKKTVDRLKQRGKVAIFTGVRFGESDVRDKSMHSACSRGGECGQGLWLDESKNLGIGYFAPIAFWRQCDVWDYVNLESFSNGHPTDKLESIYNGRDSRFGCWTCTVIQQDKTMQKIVSNSEGEHLKPLLELRNWIKEENIKDENRVKRPNGYNGRLNLDFRKKLMIKISTCESQLGYQLIDSDTRKMIIEAWSNPKYGDSYEKK